MTDQDHAKIVREGWRLITDHPDQPCPVIFFYGQAIWKDHNGEPLPSDVWTKYWPRSVCWRQSFGAWDGGQWLHADTGHEVYSGFDDPDERPTHWMPLPQAPEPTP